MRPRKHRALEVERLDKKELLSSAGVPVLTDTAFTAALSSIHHYLNGFAEDFHKKLLISNLTFVAQTIPFGQRDLLPIWQGDIGEFSLHKKGEPGLMFHKIKSDFIAYVVAGAASGKFVFQHEATGPGQKLR
jgi:hypothetical protein